MTSGQLPLEPLEPLVLLVEDDPLVSRVAERVLQRAGLRVVVASTETQALTEIDEGLFPNILVTDIILPDGNGKQLADSVCQSRPGLPVLFMSGYTDDDIEELGVNGSEVAFLQKPFSAHELQNRVLELVAEND